MSATHPSPRRDAARTRQRLLDAAGELFATRGYERTTVRDVAERAGVDPALIGRYFDSKVGLYIASLRQRHGETPSSLLETDRLVQLLTRPERIGAGPIFAAAVNPHPDAGVREVAASELAARLVAPLVQRWGGGKDAELRAEVAAAAVVGIVLTRAAGTFPQLSTATPEELATIVQPFLAGLTGIAQG